jgi:hypothetical protein
MTPFNKNGDEEGRWVTFLHYTTSEFLLQSM